MSPIPMDVPSLKKASYTDAHVHEAGCRTAPVKTKFRCHNGKFFQIGVDAKGVLYYLSAHHQRSLIVTNGFNPQRNTLSDCKGASSTHCLLQHSFKSGSMTVAARAHTCGTLASTTTPSILRISLPAYICQQSAVHTHNDT